MKDISVSKYIAALADYSIRKGMTAPEDRIWVINSLLHEMGIFSYEEPEEAVELPLEEILGGLVDYAVREGKIDGGPVSRDLLDTALMGVLTPRPSLVISQFRHLYRDNPALATDWYYQLSQDTDYIRAYRIAKDVKWITATEYGDLDITINLSKPEKDPREIAKAGQAKKSGYPSCLLCMENEGYAGHYSHPARQNHRIIPIRLDGEAYFLQYSPYVYYNEHCIILNKEHIPMKIDRSAFQKLLNFVCLFPHYTAGSNADLPIVGGSILSHDHFQGGGYIFAMAKAPFDRTFSLPGYNDLTAGIVKWPMSVIRLQGTDRERLSDAAEHILSCWRHYTDREAFIFSETDGTPHNTITPIARMHGELLELDLVLRNNITTEECPWGVYHPSADLHHIKKENIGLIEVMGLAVLPARLKHEMAVLEETILKHGSIRENPDIEKHADWAEAWIPHYSITPENIHGIIQKEISEVFIKVLECSGVFKRTPEGQEAFARLIHTL